MVKSIQIHNSDDVLNEAHASLLKKRAWSEKEDKILVQLIQQYGPFKWSYIASQMLERVGKQCRERWHNHLNPKINKHNWTPSEEWNLYLAHQLFGNKWADISRRIHGRTDNSIKNHWNSTMRKKRETYRQNLHNAISLMQTAPSKFIKQYSPTERAMIKEIFRENRPEDKTPERKTEKLETQMISNNSNFNGVLKNMQTLHWKHFDEKEFIEELYRHTFDKNLSYFQVVSFFNYIEAYEENIVQIRNQDQTECIGVCCSQMSDETKSCENCQHSCTQQSNSNKTTFEFCSTQNQPLLLIPTCFIHQQDLLISRTNCPHSSWNLLKANLPNSKKSSGESKKGCLPYFDVRNQQNLENTNVVRSQ